MMTLRDKYYNWKEYKKQLQDKHDTISIEYYEKLFDCALKWEITERDFESGAYQIQQKSNIERVKEALNGCFYIDFELFCFECRCLAEIIKGELI